METNIKLLLKARDIFENFRKNLKTDQDYDLESIYCKKGFQNDETMPPYRKNIKTFFNPSIKAKNTGIDGFWSPV